VKFRDILPTGTGHQDRRLNRDSPGQTRTYGRSTSKNLCKCVPIPDVKQILQTNVT